MITKLEELSIRAWPALETIIADGWVMRFAAGYTKRANSVYPLYPVEEELERKIEACESSYASKQLPPIFKLTPSSQPAGLDFYLAKKGYRADGRTSVQALSLTDVAVPASQTVRMYEACTDEWLEAFCRLSEKSGSEKQTMSQTLRKIIPRTCYIALYHENEVVACGLGVLDSEYIGLYDIVTDSRCRKQGFGEQLVLHLLQWGRDNGAEISYLQVIADNRPALGLYAKLGYQEVYQYWYRIKDL